MVVTLLCRGLDQEILSWRSRDLVHLYRMLTHLYKNDQDPVLKHHVELALLQINDIMKKFMLALPKLEKKISAFHSL